MRSFWSEPFLWIHLAGIAVAPLALLVLWLSLAIGEPLTPFWLELVFLAVIAVAPIFWMQWSRPFEIFSLLVVALKPDVLTDEQRKILSLFKTTKQRLLALITALIMLGLLWDIYQFAPIAALPVENFPQVRILGLIIAAIAFLVGNLFIQVPVSVLGILLTKEDVFRNVEPLNSEQISQLFTVPGFRVKKIPLVPQISRL